MSETSIAPQLPREGDPQRAREDPAPIRHTGLQVHEDVHWQGLTWKFQRAGWLTLGIALLAAAAGIFGAGPLAATKSVSTDGSLAVEYERLGRYMAPATFAFEARPAGTGTTFDLAMDRSLLDAVEIVRIMPEPLASRSSLDGVEFTFGQASADRPARVRFLLKFKQIGRVVGTAVLRDRTPVRLGAFVYP